MSLCQTCLTYFLCLSLVVVFCTTTDNATVVEKKESINNFSHILDALLVGYERTVRPGNGHNMHGPPTKIMVDMNIRSMGPISEVDMTYSMDTYFRQTWEDKRLTFESSHPILSVHIQMLEKIWKPDTYFYNGQESHLHTMTSPNKLLRIMKNGTILYSMRLTIKATCPMYLHYFPMDQQLCPLQFGSYAYTKEQVYYEWKRGSKGSIKTSPDMRLSQFDLVNHPAWNLTVFRSGGEYSILKVNFGLQRHAGYFLIQMYVPCTLIVILSWVSFWINREATADRFTLGITAVLTLTTLSLNTRDALPKVPYATALDWFVFICYGYIVASILEFGGVHYFTKIGSGEHMGWHRESDTESEDEDYDSSIPERMRYASGSSSSYTNHHNVVAGYSSSCSSTKSNIVHRISSAPGLAVNNATSGATLREPHNDGCLRNFVQCLQGNHRYKKAMRRYSRRYNANSVSLIDKVSRILFPLSFIVMNVVYWIACMI